MHSWCDPITIEAESEEGEISHTSLQKGLKQLSSTFSHHNKNA